MRIWRGWRLRSAWFCTPHPASFPPSLTPTQNPGRRSCLWHDHKRPEGRRRSAPAALPRPSSECGDGERGTVDVVLHPCLFLFPLFTVRVLVLLHHPPSSLPTPSPHPPKLLDANPPLPFRYPRDNCARRQRHRPQSVLSFYLTHDAHTELLAPYLNSSRGRGSRF
ncbi:hypothetical protein B0H16DRAFT_780713 [Mycena metata]|uniref:Uncharacterized protein n=1 Tax=Mycena metata TaxID=1033252 RepID=A0AAD7IXX9_9AGAR|nr:hypothetical protein B0H16DRAFT_780713 [Mycena metata]